MEEVDDLLAIADGLAEMKGRFVRSDKEWFLRTEDQSRFEASVAEAQAILAGPLGAANVFTFGMITAKTSSSGGLFGGPSYAYVETTESLIRAAVRQIQRKAKTPPRSIGGISQEPLYVNPARIIEITALTNDQWDFSKLVQLCNELNDVARTGTSHYATAMLVRAITDHVPPLFGAKNFSHVADNYSGTASFKNSMQNLHRSMRNIADGMLHEQIRRKESLPSPQQVDFRQDLDRLLGEIIRIVRP